MAITTPMPVLPTQLQLVPANRGLVWVRQGFAVFGRKPLAFSGLLASFLFVALLMLLVPFVGPLLLLASLPIVSLGFMIAGQFVLNGRFPLPSIYLLPLRQDRARVLAMVKLCVMYTVATVAIVALSEWIDGGRFDALQDLSLPSGGKADPEAVGRLLSDPRLQAGLLIRFGLTALLSIPFWHAPALVHWSGQSVGKSLFFSTVAVWRNRGAFTMYGLAWFALLLLVALVSSLVFGLLGQPQMIQVLAVPVTLLFISAFYASLFFTFADCFQFSPAPLSPEETPP
jgi:hypothetical protein